MDLCRLARRVCYMIQHFSIQGTLFDRESFFMGFDLYYREVFTCTAGTEIIPITTGTTAESVVLNGKLPANKVFMREIPVYPFFLL